MLTAPSPSLHSSAPTTTVTILRPGQAATSTIFSGTATARVGADGTVAVITNTGTGATAQTTVTILRRGQAATSTTRDGIGAGDAQLGADGTVVLTTRVGTGAATDPYQTTVTVLRPGQAATSTTVTGIGNPAQITAGGTIVLTTLTLAPTKTTVTVLRPAQVAVSTTITGVSLGVATANADGIVGQTTLTGNGTAADPY